MITNLELGNPIEEIRHLRNRVNELEADLARVRQERDDLASVIACGDEQISELLDLSHAVDEQLRGDGWETAACSQADRISHLQAKLEEADTARRALIAALSQLEAQWLEDARNHAIDARVYNSNVDDALGIAAREKADNLAAVRRAREGDEQ